MASAGSSKTSSAARSTQGSAAYFNVVVLSGAMSLGLWLLVSRGLIAWPPMRLLGSLATVVGCIAACGPIVLVRRGKRELATGDLLWMVGGILVWVHAALALLAGTFRLELVPTPLAPSVMGTFIGTVLIAGWLLNGGSQNWTWTNVIGWMLGCFWVGLGLATVMGVGSIPIRQPFLGFGTP